MTQPGTNGGTGATGAPAGLRLPQGGAAAALAARDRWAEAVWCSSLPPLQRLVALAYADHARDGLVGVWVVGARLLERTGVSRDAVYRALRGLESAGWLVVVERAAQHRSTRYALTMPPAAQQSVSRTAQESASRTAETSTSSSPVPLAEASSTSPRPSSTSPRPSSTGDGHDYPSYYPSHYPHVPAATDDEAVLHPSATGEGEGSAPVVVEVAALPDADHLAGTGEMVPGGAPRPGTPPAETRPDTEQHAARGGGHLAPVPAQTAAPVGPDPRRAPVEQAARAAGVAHDVLDDVVTAALADEETRSPAGRLTKDPSWVARLEREARARRSTQQGGRERELRRAGALRCEHDVEDGLALTRTGELRCLDCRRAAAGTPPRALAVVR